MGLHPEWSVVGHVPVGQSVHWVTCDVLEKDLPPHFAQSQQHSGNCDVGILYSPKKTKSELKLNWQVRGNWTYTVASKTLKIIN